MNPRGSVLVVGGGIAGVQAALDLAESGYYVHLVERRPAIGGAMAKLDKTFPTNDCSACILSPKLVECGRNLNINLLTLSELISLDGEPGDFKAVVRQHPRYVDTTKCIACGLCAEKCPKKTKNGFNMGLSERKAVYLMYPQAVPLKYAIDPDECIWLKRPGRCGACANVCPAGAINFDDVPKDHVFEVGSVVLALGFSLFDPSGLDFTGYRRIPNVVTAMEFERLLSPSGPCLGRMERPSDGKEPRRIAWLQCVGSRDTNRACRGYCSSVCCMYAIKQALIAREHAGGALDAHIFFMDIRTHGKGFEAYYNRAVQEGVRFHRSKVHSVIPADEGTLLIRYADEAGRMCEEEFDLVVLSVGMELNHEAVALIDRLGVGFNKDGFVLTSPFSPVSTSRPGVFVCGAAQEPKDIPQSVMEASAAALEAGRLLSPARWTETKAKEFPPERNVRPEPPRIGVFVCHCGINIASVVDVKAVTEYARGLPGVVFAQDNLFTCSQDTINQMAETIRRERLNRVVVASCSPRTHEPLFQETLREAGINKHLFEMANIRDQDSWVHRDEPQKATRKAMDLVRMAVAKVRGDGPLPYSSVPVTKSALVVGAGVAGMTAAVAIADQGFKVFIVERKDRLGGHARKFYRTWQGFEVQPYLEELAKTVSSHPNIELHLKSTVTEAFGSVGRFKTSLSDGSVIEHGVAIIAIGGESFKPREGKWNYLYGRHPAVHTLLELDRRFIAADEGLNGLSQAVFIHCVGSRVPERPYCSRVCCTHAIDQALKLKELNPEMAIFMLYRDIRTYGMRERLYEEARAKGIIFVRYDLDHLPEVSDDGGRLVVKAHDMILDRPVMFHPDLLVLASGVVPRDDAGGLAGFFKCAMDQDGFLLEAHMKLRPVDFATEGVFLAGLCHYPKPMDESIAQAKAAAARAVTILSRDAVSVESMTAYVDTAKCTGCAVCTQICPYAAINIDQDTGRAVVDIGLCKGCGACAASCRSGAVSVKNLGNEQIMAAIESAMDMADVW
ncbi:MAG: FAD-dependent oxidoreductase [Dissulfurimicrobium sp.]|nr:CoB--CoM heterodisulfide reductase iron-sulfur subunit A family protein [Dissulfurimicrobium hydrothermale]UKL13567.1 CoB--CoM heterodisulfide reductase iron-sulfur subunit A family protein [Dissulfurimicrobium hydrothermale]